MRLRHLGKKIAGVVFGFSLLLGIGMATNSTANAQYGNDQRDRQDQRRRDRNDNNNRPRRGRNWDGYGNNGGSPQLRQTALNAGYNEGQKAGRDDRRKNRRYEFRDSSSYQKATKDYNSRLGDREIFKQYFRQAFENGYSDGYQGY